MLVSSQETWREWCKETGVRNGVDISDSERELLCANVRELGTLGDPALKEPVTIVSVCCRKGLCGEHYQRLQRLGFRLYTQIPEGREGHCAEDHYHVRVAGFVHE